MRKSTIKIKTNNAVGLPPLFRNIGARHMATAKLRLDLAPARCILPAPTAGKRSCSNSFAVVELL